MNLNKKYTLLGIILVLLVSFYLIFASLNTKGKVAVDFVIAPSMAVLKIDGLVSSKSIKLTGGSHNIEVSYNGFRTYSEKLNIKKGNLNKYGIALEPETDYAKQLAKTLTSEYLEVEKIGSQSALISSEILIQKNPILNYIPFKTSYYSIDYSVDDKTNIVTVQINANSPLGRQVAIEKLRTWGFEPSDLNVEFTGLMNPFVSIKGGNY